MDSAKSDRVDSRLLSSGWLQSVLFVTSVIFGLLVRPILAWAIAPAVSTRDRAVLVTLVLWSLVALLAINVALALHSKRKRRDETIARDIAALSRSAGLRAVFLHEGNREPGQDAYTIMSELVAGATHELLILDHRPALTSTRFYDQTPPKSASREAYYDLLTSKAKSKDADGRYFRYRRIVQLEEGPTGSWDMSKNSDTLFADHCRALVTYRATNPKAVCSITTSRVFYPQSSIVIADGTRVLIEMAVVGPNGQARVEGDLVFYDPAGVLAGPLRELFEHIDAEATLVSEVK
jgi:hypothetical protein